MDRAPVGGDADTGESPIRSSRGVTDKSANAM